MRGGGGWFYGFLGKGLALHRCTIWSKNVHFFWLGGERGIDEKAWMNWSIGGTYKFFVWLLKEEECVSVCFCSFFFGVVME